MFIARVIPVLTIRNGGLVKTVEFRKHRYVGDVTNAVRIFNEKEVDELILLDIDATIEGRGPPFDLVADVASECFMPLCYGGGVRNVDDVRMLLSLGVEKVSLNSEAVRDPGLVRRVADLFGSSTIVVSLDVKKTLFGGYEILTRGGRSRTGLDPVVTAQRFEAMGAGEILLNCIDRDGTMKGYDLALIRSVTESVSIPLIACGGAGTATDLSKAIHEGGASAAAASGLFVFYGKRRAVLINYPSRSELDSAFAR